MEKIIATMMYNNNKFYLSLILSLTMLLQSFCTLFDLTLYYNVIKGSATDSTRREDESQLIGSCCPKDAHQIARKPYYSTCKQSIISSCSFSLPTLKL